MSHVQRSTPARGTVIDLVSAHASAAPGMKTSVVLALLGAIAAEFVGAEAGLGYLMSQLMFKLDTPGVFAILVVLSVIGVSLYLLADWAHRKTVFWDAAAHEPWTPKQ